LIGCAFTRVVLHRRETDQPAVIRRREAVGAAIEAAERFAFGLVGREELAAAAVAATVAAAGVNDFAPVHVIGATGVAPVTAVSATTSAVFAAEMASYISVNIASRRPRFDYVRIAAAVRLNQARILTMFQPHPWSERARAMGRKWVETYWATGDDWLTRQVLSDLLEEEGWDGQGHLVRALRELPIGQYLLGYGPMIPDQDEGG